MLLTTSTLYDGRSPLGEGWLRVAAGEVVEYGLGRPPAHLDQADRRHHPCLMPGMIDAHCHLVGHVEVPGRDEPFAAQRAFADLLREAGVGTVRDLGNHAETCASVERLPDAPVIVQSGPVIDEPPGRVTYSRLITDIDGARTAVRRAAAEGATWIKTYAGVRAELLAVVVAEAAGYGMRVTHRPGRTDAVTAARIGVAGIEHLPLCVAPGDPATARPATAVISAWADPQVSRFVPELAATLAEAQVAVTPLLLAWRRRAVLDEAVHEPMLDRLLPIMPYHQYLRQMTGAGLAFGRRYARQYLGYERLRGQEAERFARGWDALLAALVTLHSAGVRLVAGSDAPGVSLVPGYALHRELEIWAAAGLDRPATLAAATGQAADLLGLSTWRSGVLALPDDPLSSPSLTATLAAGRFVLPPASAAAQATVIA